MLRLRFIGGALLVSGLLMAQNPTATITGQVLDASGAVVPAAKVRARNMETNIERRTVTSESGDYTIPFLPIGRYEVSVEKPGFKREVRGEIVLQVDQRARLDFVLQLGQVSEIVEVSAAAPLIQTDSASVGTVVENRKIVDMPLNSREFYSLGLLVPGVAPSAQGSLLSFRGGFNVAGVSEIANNYTVNGLDNNNSTLNGPAFRPSVDAIQEFKILTGTYGAEYGHASGGQIVVTLKSGTNAFHGNVFEFLRNQVFDARNFFSPAKIPAFKRNQFGGTLGGPIIRNKTFFFASYEGLRLREEVTARANVPLPEMINGDFRHLLTLPAPIRVRNPFTGQEFATPNVMDPGLIHSTGRDLARFYPPPSVGTLPGALPASNYFFDRTRVDTLDQGSLRIDHTFSPKDTLSGHYNDFDERTFEPSNIVCGTRLLPGFGCDVDLKARLSGLAETHVFSPRLVNEFRMAYSQFWNPRFNEDRTIDFVGEHKIPGVAFDRTPKTPGVPQTSVLGYATLGASTNLPQLRIDHTYQLADNVTFTRGRHAFKWGMEWRRFQVNGISIQIGRGVFTFNATPTAATSGYALADLLLGLPTLTQRNPFFPPNYLRTTSWGAFLQDDWRVSPRLTLNLGVRYELNTPPFDKQDRLSNFDPAAGKLLLSGQDFKEFYHRDLNNFGPRVGLSWQPFAGGRTVIRAGLGIYYNAPPTNNIRNGASNNPPFQLPQTFNSSRAVPITLTDPFPAAAAGAGTLTVSAINRNYPDALIQQWSLGIQQQLTATMGLELSYQGSKGTRLPAQRNLNQPRPGPGTLAQVNTRRPYPAYGNIAFLDAVGNSSYQALLVRVEKRYSAGLSFLTSYTWGKSIDDTPGTPFNVTPSRATAQDSRNLRAERGLSGFDVRQRFVASPIYELPAGRGHRLFSHGVPAILAGGWQVSGILTAQTGRPFTALVTQNISNTFTNADRPNVVGAGNAGPHTVGRWFNTSAFQLPAIGTFGNAGRNNLNGPGLSTLDFALSRVVRARERYSVQFRAELFNAFNHSNFNLPVQTVDTPASFGQITSAQPSRQVQFGLKIGF